MSSLVPRSEPLPLVGRDRVPNVIGISIGGAGGAGGAGKAKGADGLGGVMSSAGIRVGCDFECLTGMLNESPDCRDAGL